MNMKKLIREQLEVSLRRFEPLRSVSLPPKGWIRAIRDALGMSAKQLGQRMGIAQQAVARIENDELAGSVTIKTMRRVAEGLDCEFVYGFVPRTSLDTSLRTRAQKLASSRLNRASHNMKLEGQGLSPEENRQILSRMVDELVEKPPADLWSES